MDLSERLQNVAVLGAAGKMGSGIALLLANELARAKHAPESEGRTFRLALIDQSEEALTGLMTYLRTQLTKFAEKSINDLRRFYAEREDLVENGEMIEEFVTEALFLLRPATTLQAAAGSTMIFEAVFEDEELKAKILSEALTVAHEDAWVLTNTSSIPIGGLDERLRLGGRIIGYHFYNPPAVQKLLELITTDGTRPDLKEASATLAKRLGKKVVPSNDVAGFIGNGHFMRDALHAIAAADRLRAGGDWAAPLYKINRVSQEWLIRPMGIFQLIDYVGVDVAQLILNVMNRHLPGQGIGSELIDALIARSVRGGQNPDGSQKDGIFRYEGGRPSAVYALDRNGYLEFDSEPIRKADAELGSLPEGTRPWKALLKERQRDAVLEAHFAALRSSDTEGARLAMEYLAASKAIAEKLVVDGVANSADDVNQVLTNGFFHLYGPINEFTGEVQGVTS